MTLYPNNTTKQVVNNELNKKLKKFDERIENNSSEITSLKSRVSNTEDNITSINGDIEGLEEDIGSLDTRVDTVELALDEKQDTLNFDNVPTDNSDNPVKSGGIYNALETKLDKESVKFDPEPNGTDALSTGGAYDIVQDISERIDNIQNQGALLSNDNIDISNNGCLKIDNQQEVETDAIEVLNGDTKLKDTEINGDLSVSGNIDGNVATHSANGLMSSEDKVRLDAIDSSLEDKTVSDTLTDSSTVIPSGKAVSDVISSLDASSVGGSGKYISEISETNGVITATSEDIDTAVTSGSSKPITSGGVANILSNLPTDAVLHYSFDDLPDLPDGTAVYKKDNDFTDITDWAGTATVSITNNKLNIAGTLNQFIYKLFYSYPAGSLIIVKGISKSDALIEIRASQNGSDISLKSFNVYENKNFTIYILVTEATSNFIIRGLSNNWDIEISQLYIGDGSYSTPIIDNANGQNNATNNCGIAVNGVSGKGTYFLKGKYCSLPSNFNLSLNFTVSLWVKPDNDTNYLNGTLIAKDSHLSIRNGTESTNKLLLQLSFSDNTSANLEVANLLTSNVWTNLVVTRSGTTLKVYENGEQVYTTTISSQPLIVNSNIMNICTVNNTRPQSIDDFQIFDRALSETEVMALYLNKANTPKYYNLNNFKLDLIPLPPTTDGTFQLTATVSNGSVSYSWV